MKTMTCEQLGGACDVTFSAETFDEIAKLSQEHGKQMHAANDEAHLKAMSDMMELMQKPEEVQKWFAAKKAEFDTLPDDS